MLRKLLPVAALFIAVALPLGLGWTSHRAQMSGEEVRVKIEAYDPRDLLYGHYLTFRIKWPLPEKRASMGKDACLCVGSGAVDPPVSVMACHFAREKGACHAVLTGRDYGGDRFDIGINRYYVDEAYAKPLETMVRAQTQGRADEPKALPDEAATFRIGLTLRPNGKAVVRNLYVGDQPLADYLRDHGAELLQNQP